MTNKYMIQVNEGGEVTNRAIANENGKIPEGWLVDELSAQIGGTVTVKEGKSDSYTPRAPKEKSSKQIYEEEMRWSEEQLKEAMDGYADAEYTEAEIKQYRNRLRLFRKGDSRPGRPTPKNTVREA